VLHPLGLLGLLAAAVSGAPVGVVVAPALASGLTFPPVAAVMRALDIAGRSALVPPAAVTPAVSARAGDALVEGSGARTALVLAAAAPLSALLVGLAGRRRLTGLRPAAG
jgi:hypothetical protein